MPDKKFLFIPLLTLILSSSFHAQETTGFDKTFTLQNITFHISCPNNASLNRLTIQTKGLKHNEVVTKEIDGTVSGAGVADLNEDAAPEVYVFTTSAGSGSYGSVVAFSSNQNKSLSEIYFPEDTPQNNTFKGYMGHDTFSLGKNRLLRDFPLYKKSDSNAHPSGGVRELEYKLVPGEATWLLKLVKSTDTKQ